MPSRHSIFWRLVVLVAGFCLAMIWAADYIGKQIDHRTSYLSEDARTILVWGKGYLLSRQEN